MTSAVGYEAITRDKKIYPNNGRTAFSFPESELSNCYELGGVSLWDFQLPSESVIYDRLSVLKRQTVLLHHQPAVFLGFERQALTANLLYYDEIKRRCGFGGIVPDVELCHIGEIRLDLATHILVTTHEDHRLKMWKTLGYQLSPDALVKCP
jgi:hypothetical protein